MVSLTLTKHDISQFYGILNIYIATFSFSLTLTLSTKEILKTILLEKSKHFEDGPIIQL